MRYSAIVVFTRVSMFGPGGVHLGDKVIAERVSSAHDHVTVVELPMGKLYAGHAEWVGEQIEASEERKALRFASAPIVDRMAA